MKKILLSLIIFLMIIVNGWATDITGLPNLGTVPDGTDELYLGDAGSSDKAITVDWAMKYIVKAQSDCSGITVGLCIDTDDGIVHYYDGDSVEVLGSVSFESISSNDIDPDRLAGDTTDDNLIDPDILNIGSLDLSYSCGDGAGSLASDRSYSGIPMTGLTVAEIIDHGELVYIDSTPDINLADADSAGEAPAWGYFVLYDKLTGTHDGSENAATLSDSGASFTTDVYISSMVYNITDGSSCVVTDNDSTTVTCSLSGGTDNDWDSGDSYEVGLAGVLSVGCVRNDTLFGFGTNGVLLYLDDDTAGLTVEAAAKPATTGDVLQPVGRSITDDVLKANVNPETGFGTVD